jgi:hypothetical protein
MLTFEEELNEQGWYHTQHTKLFAVILLDSPLTEVFVITYSFFTINGGIEISKNNSFFEAAIPSVPNQYFYTPS